MEAKDLIAKNKRKGNAQTRHYDTHKTRKKKKKNRTPQKIPLS